MKLYLISYRFGVPVARKINSSININSCGTTTSGDDDDGDGDASVGGDYRQC